MTVPLVSILIPSRDRPQQLQRTVRSLLASAIAPERVEILVRYDSDDDATAAAVQQLRSEHSLLVAICGGQGRGWQDNHQFYNQLAAVSLGTWLFMFNDDAVLRTEKWDAQLTTEHTAGVLCPTVFRKNSTKPLSFKAPTPQYHICTLRNAFPLVHRSVYETLGCFSRHAHADVYLEWMVLPTGLQRPVGLTIQHDSTRSQQAGADSKHYWRDFLVGPLAEQIKRDRRSLQQIGGRPV